ncbi:MAG: DUF2088 domain-containing protein [Lachnospiraceae bacterium]|nr:DUF2088 domain-containing protein [Lachnospiraceae bacterium]
MNAISELLKNYEIPKVAKVRQTFNNDVLEDVVGTLRRGLEEKCAPIKPGDRIAITCGSRGIDKYALIIKTVADFVKSKGGQPILIPAMGSHGGATAEGQREVLRRYGISEETIGAPVLATMEVNQIGTTPRGLPVYIDRNACECDGIILVNRVKLHTSFRGKYESGLLKMMAIGLAKQKGAEMTHFLRFENMASNIEMVGTVGLENLNILCGVSTIENGYNHLAELHVSRKDEIKDTEPGYLIASRERMPRIALDEIDVLIVNEIGKEISGTGMDTNIIGRYHTNAASGGPNTIKLGVLNLTEKSEGNGNGMGLADFMPQHMFDQVDLQVSYMNTITSTEPNSTRIPMILANDKEVFQAGVKLCGQIKNEDIRLVIIRSTKYLDEVYMSEAAVKAAVKPVEVIGPYEPVPFDENGNLVLFEAH